MSIIRRGLYRVNVMPGDATELIVRKGRVMLEDSHTKVKGGNKVVFSNSSFSVAKLQDADKKDSDTIAAWSKDRAQTLAKANSKISGRTLMAFASSFRNDWFSSGLLSRSGFWLYNSNVGCYTFLPFGYGWGSPYGGAYSSFFYGRGPIYTGPVYPGNGVGYSSGSGGSTSGGGTSGSGSSGGTSPGSGYNPPVAPSAPRESPMMGHGKPDLSPGGDGPAIRPPIKE
jgi:hypothetical protein